jgi:alpha-glucoside transport system substrate-binding protein
MKINPRIALGIFFGFTLILSACGTQVSVQSTPPNHTPLTNTPASTEAPTEPIMPPNGINCMGAKSGDTISMYYQWSEVDEENLNKILQPLLDACGIVLKLEASQDQGFLEDLVKSGTPPDIAFSKVNQLAQYKSLLIPMTDLGVQAEHYADYWKTIGAVDGRWLGLPVKVDIKTVLWYSPANFQAHGYQVPTNGNEFLSLISQMASDGNPPFSTGFIGSDATGQMGVDLVDDITLMDSSPEIYNLIITGKIAYNNATVKNAYRDISAWVADPSYSAGGAQGTLSTDIKGAIAKVFSDPPEAMMLRLPGSAGAIIAAQYPDLKFGSGFDLFMAPGALNTGIHGSSDWMMAFSDSAAVKALVAYLSSNQGGQMWAQVGFGITPNNTGTNSYTDEILQKQAQILANAKTFVPDLGEAIPGGFADAERKAVVDFLKGADLDAVLNQVTAVQMQALGK